MDTSTLKCVQLSELWFSIVHSDIFLLQCNGNLNLSVATVKLKWVGYVACVVDVRNAYGILTGKSQIVK